MTFRPADDVLDGIESWQSSSLLWTQYNIQNQDGDEHEQHIFNSQENQWDFQDFSEWNKNSVVIDIPIEEVKAPDLSELLKNNWNKESTDEWLNNDFSEDYPQKTESTENVSNPNISPENTEDTWAQVLEQNEPNLGEGAAIQESVTSEESQINHEQNYIDADNKLSDEERIKIVSSIPWSINSNLDYLVDRNWLTIIKKYKVINRIFFRWWIFIFAVIIGILWWIMLQVKATNSNNIQIINDSSIKNKWKWVEETPDKILSGLSNQDINILVPYGLVSYDEKSFQSKSNLIKYKWIIVPQLFSINYNSQSFISLDDFSAHKTTREDIKNLIKILITDDSNYRKTSQFPNIEDLRWVWNTFEGSLREGFNLWCLKSNKVSDFVCDKFLDAFYTYWKYFDLSKYSDDLLEITKNIRDQKKDIQPICNMVKDYTLRARVVSNTLVSVMEYCRDDYDYYKKMVDFIDLENSLKQPELSNKVFDDPDLNAYKLISAQQNVHRSLDGMSINENYIKSYLNFVQNLIDKDRGTNYYLQPIYKDLLYVFNMDELQERLMQKWNLSSDLKTKIDQINNWNSVYWYSSLLSQLTTKDIVQKAWDSSYEVVNERSIEEIFSQYYANEHLTIRNVKKLSENEIKVQTEVSTEKISSATNWETLKVTVVLRKQDNILYIETIKVANQPKFTDILSIYASEGNVSFYAMLNYIDEQVWMRYEPEPEELEEQPTFCENIMERSDISVYDCDDSFISLYKWEVEYNFVLVNWMLDSFTISDENIDKVLKDKLDWIFFTKDETPWIIMIIVDYTLKSEDNNVENKWDVLSQFRIHFKLDLDDIHDIEWEPNKFLVEFTLWDFELQGYYDVNTHLLTKIAFTNCKKPLEIKQLSLEITAENEPQLMEILNNPKVFFVNANPTIYKKYQKTCLWIQ